MAYTIGIKRRFWFGYRKVTVSGHDWQNGRFILNLTDGTQEHVPGFATPGIKVYADFWNHLAQVERSRPAPVPAPQPVRQGATVQTAQPVEAAPQTEPQVVQLPPDPMLDEVRRRAAQRVSSILSGEWQAQ